MDVHDVTKQKWPGINVIAIQATNADAGMAGLAAQGDRPSGAASLRAQQITESN